MLALVATPRFLLLVDLESRRVSVIEDGRQEYYGITWRPGGDQLILSHSGLDNESLVDLESYALSEVGWISAGPLHSSRFLSQPHQILCGPDGRVICTNTGRNSVVVIDPARPGHYQETQLHPDRWDRLEPTAAHKHGLAIRRIPTSPVASRTLDVERAFSDASLHASRADADELSKRHC